MGETGAGELGLSLDLKDPLGEADDLQGDRGLASGRVATFELVGAGEVLRQGQAREEEEGEERGAEVHEQRTFLGIRRRRPCRRWFWLGGLANGVPTPERANSRDLSELMGEELTNGPRSPRRFPDAAARPRWVSWDR